MAGTHISCSVLGFKLESQLLEIEAMGLLARSRRAGKKTLIPLPAGVIAIACVIAAVLSNSHPNGDDPLLKKYS